jgi:hypothetical protein
MPEAKAETLKRKGRSLPHLAATVRPSAAGLRASEGRSLLAVGEGKLLGS